MSHNRFVILAAVLLLCFFGVSGTAGIRAYAARTENAEQRIYTPYELGCMAQYYYKRTSKDGYYPPAADCQKEKDGTYLVKVYEKVDDGKGKSHDVTYAQYRLDRNAKGKDLSSGKTIDLTLYSKVYTPEELCKLAKNYYYTTNDFYPPNSEYRVNKDGTYTIRLYEVIEDESGTEHNATCCWYTVNVCGVGKDDLLLQDVDFNK